RVLAGRPPAGLHHRGRRLGRGRRGARLGAGLCADGDPQPAGIPHLGRRPAYPARPRKPAIPDCCHGLAIGRAGRRLAAGSQDRAGRSRRYPQGRGMTEPVLIAEKIGRTLPGDPPVTLVAEADLAIEPGKFTAIVGPSGCGKSSLLYLLGLIDRPTSGKLLLDGRDVTPLSGDARARIRLERFGFVFQFHFLLPEFTALENVMLPIRRLGRLSLDKAEARARDLLGQ